MSNLQPATINQDELLTNKELLALIPGYISILTASIILMQAISIMWYYSIFNFPIESYFTISYIISYFISQLGSYFVGLTIFLLVSVFVAAFANNFIRKKEEREKFTKSWRWGVGLTFFGLFFLPAIYRHFFHIEKYTYNFNPVYWMIGFGILWGFYDERKKHGITVKYIIKMFFASSITYTVLTTSNYQFKAEGLLNRSDNRNVSIVMENEVIPAHSPIYYIGKTEAYYFVYDSVYSKVRVIKEADVKEINFY